MGRAILKGTVHPKLKVRTFSVSVEALVTFFNPHNGSRVSWEKIIPPSAITMEANGGHVIKCKEINGWETQHVSKLLVWCAPSVWKTEQSNLSQNRNVNATFLVKISTVAF